MKISERIARWLYPQIERTEYELKISEKQARERKDFISQFLPDKKKTVRVYIAYITVEGQTPMTHKVAFTGLYFTGTDESIFQIGNASPDSPFNGIPSNYSESRNITNHVRDWHGAGWLTYIPYKDLEFCTIIVVDWFDAWLGVDLNEIGDDPLGTEEARKVIEDDSEQPRKDISED